MGMPLERKPKMMLKTCCANCRFFLRWMEPRYIDKGLGHCLGWKDDASNEKARTLVKEDSSCEKFAKSKKARVKEFAPVVL